MNIIELRRALDAKRKEMKTMLESAQENRSVDFQTKFDVLKAEAESLKFSLNELEQLEAEEQRTLETHSGSETRKFEMPTKRNYVPFCYMTKSANAQWIHRTLVM